MSTSELVNVKFFLKNLANEYSDMELLGKNIPDAEKSKEAIRIGKEFRKNIRDCDDAVSKGDLNKLLELYPITNNQIATFIELLQDVPDEL